MAALTFDPARLARKLEAAGFQPKPGGDTATAKAEILRWKFSVRSPRTDPIVTPVKRNH